MSYKPVPFNMPAPWWWVLLPILQVVALVAFASPPVAEWGLMALFVAITAGSSWRLFSDGRPYSLNKVWWVFCLVFLGLVPSLQLASGPTPDRIELTRALWANGLILLSCCIYEGVRLWASRNFIPQPEHAPPPVSPVLIRQYAHLAPALMLSCGAALLIAYGFNGFVFREHVEPAFWHEGGSFRVVLEHIARATMLWCCLAAIVLFRQHKLGRSTLILVLVPGVLFNFPTAIPPYLVLSIYLACALAAGSSLLRRSHALALILIAAFLLPAPLVGGLQPSAAKRHPVAGQIGYDAWTSLAATLQHCAEQGHTGGRQIIGSMLFFVPQSVWPAKPAGSGALIGTDDGLLDADAACTFIAEGYIDFGLPGSLVFTAVLALLIARYDGWYWRRGGRVRFTLPRIFYFAGMGLLFLTLRGDLMAGLAASAGYCLVFTIWQALFFWRLRKKDSTAA